MRVANDDHDRCKAAPGIIDADHDIMSVSEREQAMLAHRERRMAITIAASAAVSIEDANRDIMSAEEKNAAAKQTYSFLAPLTNEQPCEAGR